MRKKRDDQQAMKSVRNNAARKRTKNLTTRNRYADDVVSYARSSLALRSRVLLIFSPLLFFRLYHHCRRFRFMPSISVI